VGWIRATRIAIQIDVSTVVPVVSRQGEEAGVWTASLYKHFPDGKDEIYETLAEERVSRSTLATSIVRHAVMSRPLDEPKATPPPDGTRP
jgi:hypothetical protein